MSAPPPSPAIRIGCVPYLNARPLIEGLANSLTLAHPAKLAPRLRSGELDVALLPVRAILDLRDPTVVAGAGIASQGPVLSVLLAHHGNLAAINAVRLDPASQTSAQLVRVVLERFHALRPQYHEGPPSDDLTPPADREGILKIGDQALAFRRAHAGSLACLDLGGEWDRFTRLPFVYALWCFRPGFESTGPVADRLRTAMKLGRTRINAIAATAPEPEMARTYLEHHIRHRIGPAEKRGLERFAEELHAVRALADPAVLHAWRWA